MKKLIVVAILSLTLSGIAQEKKDQTNLKRTEFTAQQKNDLQVKKLTLELDLNAKQQKEIAEIVSKQQSKREAAKTEMKTRRAENKKLTADEKFVLKSRILDEKIAFKSQIKKVLTAEQAEKWEKLQNQKMNGKKQRMHSKRMNKK